MVARVAVNGCLNLADETERLLQVVPIFNQIAGEADKLRIQFVDCANDFRRIIGVAFVMEIGEMNEAEFRVVA